MGNTVLEEISDVNTFTDEEELKIGNAFANKHEQEVRFFRDPIVNNYS